MAAVNYPTSLPGPSQLTSEPKVRARTSGLPGAENYTAPERDYYGTVSVNFFFDREQAGLFKAWWDTNKGYWFNAVWPRLSPSLSVYRILGVPTFTHVYNGAYRVSAKIELRGASLAVKSPTACDPTFFDVAILCHFDNVANGSVPAVYSDVGNFLQIQDGAVSSLDSKFGGASARLIGNSARVYPTRPADWRGPASFSPRSRDFCIEVWAKFPLGATTAPIIFMNYDDQTLKASFLYYTTGGGLFVSDNVNIVATASSGTIPLEEWFHLAWCRGRVFVNGVLKAAWEDNHVYDSVEVELRVPANSINGSTSVHYYDELRYTIGSPVYTSNFTPPPAPFPDVACAPFPNLYMIQSQRSSGVAKVSVLASSKFTHKVTTGTPYSTSAFVSAWIRKNGTAHSGKKYGEFQIIGIGDSTGGVGRGYVVGLIPDGTNSTRPLNPLGESTSAYLSNINYFGGTPGVGGGTGGAGLGLGDFLQSDVIGMAVDYATNKVWFRVGTGAWLGGGDPATGASPSVTVASAAGMLPFMSGYLRAANSNFEVRFRALGDTFTGETPIGFSPYS